MLFVCGYWPWHYFEVLWLIRDYLLGSISVKVLPGSFKIYTWYPLYHYYQRSLLCFLIWNVISHQREHSLWDPRISVVITCIEVKGQGQMTVLCIFLCFCIIPLIFRFLSDVRNGGILQKRLHITKQLLFRSYTHMYTHINTCTCKGSCIKLYM